MMLNDMVDKIRSNIGYNEHTIGLCLNLAQTFDTRDLGIVIDEYI